MSDLISRADAIEAVESTNPKDKEYHYYKHIAVSALEEIPSAEFPKGDLVSREQVIELVDDMFYHIPKEGLLAEIKALPSAEAEWIPCSERLPSEDGRYLVTYPLLRWQNNWTNLMHYGKPSMPNCEVKGKCFYVSDDEWGDVVYDNIIAWMPLPKPYREESEAEE